ncbi:DUF262 domain-containing protein [Halonotius pteroides]|uniref:DUF262 domain-containing protein n=1 Tax=Halonotius pteroides TaxID=268735 RepID=A0A3A6QJZ5_9EURY|nr:DUF262 domain-containing protein [Halonotius pteroides]RJX47574.1 DUF262 domain-containing protein [Halonotius pteroides]
MQATFKTVRGLFTTPPSACFRVPEYQRGYEWDEKNFEDLWADLQRVGERVEKHFMGNIILLTEGDQSELQIVDGQQRMTTISLFIMAIRDHPNRGDSHDKIIDDILESYKSGETQRRLSLYDDADDAAFERIWNGNVDDLSGNIGDAYSFFRDRLEGYSQDELSTLLDNIVQNLKVVRTKAEDPSLAYMIFQSQNERGVEVDPEVLIKARIFGEADRADDPADGKFIKERWKNVYDMLESNLSRPRFTDNHVIRRPITQMLINSDTPTPNQLDGASLYRTFDEALQAASSTMDFVDDFHSQTKDYLQISSSNYDVQASSLSNEEQRQLQYFNSSSSHAEILTIAIINNADDDSVGEAIHLATILGMRMRLGGYRSSRRKKAVHSAASLINDGNDVRESLINTINEKGPDDGEIIEHVRSNTLPIRGAWRFRTLLTLVSIEENRRGPLRASLDDLHIEHIAPRNSFNDNSRSGRDYAKWRRSLDQQEFDDEVGKDKIGNLTLLDGTDHARIPEDSFSSKRKVYRNSDIRITEDVADYDVWDMDTINHRSKELATELARIWSV